MSTITIIILTALLSSFFTLVIFLVSYKLFLGKIIDEKFHTKTEEAADKIEERIKNRFLDVFADASGDLLKDRARNAAKVAKSGAEIFEDRMSSFVNRLSNAADSVLTPPKTGDKEDK